MYLGMSSIPTLPMLHLVSILLYTSLFTIILNNRPKAWINRSCALVLFCFIIWCLGKVVTHFPGAPLSQAEFFRNIVIVGAWLLGPSLLLFSFALTGNTRYVHKSSFWAALLGIPILSIIMQWYGDVLLNYVQRPFGWGLSWKVNIWSFILLAHIFVTVFFAAFICISHGLKTNSRKKKIQCYIIGICIVCGMIIGYGTNILSPFLGYKIPDLAQNLGLIWMVGVVCAIIRYDFLELKPSGIADEILETMSDGLFLSDVNGNIITVNNAGRRMLSVEEKDLFNSQMEDYFPSDEILRIVTDKDWSGGQFRDRDDLLIDSEGVSHNVSISLSQLKDNRGKKAGTLIIARDISERKMFEDQLQRSHTHLEKEVLKRTESLSDLNLVLKEQVDQKERAVQTLEQREAMFRLISEQSLLGIVMLFGNRIVYANRAWEDVTGFSKEEMLSWEPTDFIKQVHPDDRQHMLEQAQKKQQAGTEYQTCYDWRLITKENQVKWISMFSKPVPYKGGIADLATMIDITDKKNIFLTLKESEEKYRLLVENANDGIYIIQDGLIKFVNKSGCLMCGYTSEELLMKPFESFIHPDERSKAKKLYTDRINGKDIYSTHTYRVFSKSQDMVYIQTNAVRIIWNGRPATLNFARDLTREKKYETMALHNQRLEAIGTMAGGIAHDFNNLLTPILGYAELLQENLHDSKELSQHAEQVIRAASRGKELIQQILAFSRKKVAHKLEVEPHSIFKESVKLSKAVLPKNISIEYRYEENCGHILADATQLHQVAMNLITNAHQAMVDEGGILTLDMKRIKNPGCLGQDVKDCILLSVADTGNGMDKQTVERIFDPYFSTKEKSSGLGLPTVLAILDTIGAYITVESQISQGTCFKLYFPLVERKQKNLDKREPVSTGLNGSERIMLVDDELQILQVFSRILSRKGYKVKTFQSPKKALKHYYANPDYFDLLITDISMPELSGVELAQKVIEEKQGIPVIIITGYNDMLTSEDADRIGINELLVKPVHTEDLLKAVRQHVNSPTMLQ